MSNAPATLTPDGSRRPEPDDDGTPPANERRGVVQMTEAQFNSLMNRSNKRHKSDQRKAGSTPKTFVGQFSTPVKTKFYSLMRPLKTFFQMSRPLSKRDDYVIRTEEEIRSANYQARDGPALENMIQHALAVNAAKVDRQREEDQWPSVIGGMFLLTEMLPKPRPNTAYGSKRQKLLLNFLVADEDAKRKLLELIQVDPEIADLKVSTMPTEFMMHNHDERGYRVHNDTFIQNYNARNNNRRLPNTDEDEIIQG